MKHKINYLQKNNNINLHYHIKIHNILLDIYNLKFQIKIVLLLDVIIIIMIY